MPEGCAYDLTELPEGVVLANDENRSNKSVVKWSGKLPIPAIGDRVWINFNDFGKGVVESYFVEHDWLGLYVKVDMPPAWHVKQCPRGHKRYGHAMVFGVEIKHLTHRGEKINPDFSVGETVEICDCQLWGFSLPDRAHHSLRAGKYLVAEVTEIGGVTLKHETAGDEWYCFDKNITAVTSRVPGGHSWQPLANIASK